VCSGASLINSNLLLRVEQQRKAEQKIVDDIKKKMDRIRERHLKERNKRTRELDELSPEQEPSAEHIYMEPTDHYEGHTSLSLSFLVRWLDTTSIDSHGWW